MFRLIAKSQRLLLAALLFSIALWPFSFANSLEKTIKSSLTIPELDVKAWALMEVNSGWVVAGENIHEKLPPASITKLMSNYVVFAKLANGDINFKDQVSISEQAWRAEGSRMFADVNTSIELEHLLKSTIIQSGNDAAIALAEYVGGSEASFAQMMNQAANDLGLTNSNFKNSTGLPATDHFMSAADIATLSAALIREFPDFYTWYAIKEYTHNSITQYNRNKLLWKDSTVDGLKTGHTNAAGYCLVGTATRKGQRWIAVVLGSEGEREREQEVLSLLNFAYAAYQPGQLLNQQEGIASVDVYGGEVDEVRLQAMNAANVVVPSGRLEDVKTELLVSPYFEAPIEIGQPMGIASLTLDGEHVLDIPLTSMSTIRKGSWWKTVKDSIRLRWRNWMADD